MLSSHDILSKKFDRAAIGGYRTDDVDNFINDLAGSFDELQEQNTVLTKKLEVLAEKLEEYRSDEESLRAALLGAQKLGDSVIRESKNKAEIILRDATIKAERIVNSAHDQLEKEKMVYLKMQKDVAAFKNKLLAIYKQHLELISSLPDDPSKAEQAQARAEAAAEKAQKEAAEKAEQQQPVQEEAENTPQPEQHPEPSSVRYEIRRDRQAAAKPQPAEEAESYEEPAPRPRKFIPVPQREAPEQDSPKKSPYADEYYEDFGEQDDKIDVPTEPPKKSRFGTLKFGNGYDLKRD